jgi:2,4-dienoyl-CoA reductase-like NADH-dependent reductase (Old Yellow Enzyme family)
MPIPSLFEPLTLKRLKLKNRFVMAPMTRAFSPNGIPTADVVAYYRRRAEHAVGLIVSEGVAVARPAAKNNPKVPHFYGEALPLWQEVIDQVHAAGGKMAPQLWHVGVQRNAQHPQWQPSPIDSPSGLTGPGTRTTEPMSESAIQDTLHAFQAAAADAVRLGFDAVELHGAHGYLIDQFFWHGTNAREDSWGGATVRERSRFAAEIIRQVRQVLPADMPLLLRLSQWKLSHFEAKIAATPEEMREWLEPLAEAGVDVFHCSQRRYWEPEFAGSDLNFAGWAKKLTGKITITVGAVGLSSEFMGAFSGETSHSTGIEEAVRRLERGDFDLVAVGRALLGDPAWVEKIRDGRDQELQNFSPELLAKLY